MSDIGIFVVANAASVASVIFAGFLAMDGNPAWEWFLFAAVMLSVSWESGS